MRSVHEHNRKFKRDRIVFWCVIIGFSLAVACA